MKKITAFLLIYLFNTILAFNIIPLDEALSLHQEAFKNFEPYASNSQVEVSYHRVFNGHVKISHYQFPSLQAKNLFLLYKTYYDKLISRIYINTILKAFILGSIESYYYNFFQSNNFFNKKSLSLNLIASIVIIWNENINKSKEPYIDLGTLKKQNDLFGSNDKNTIKRLLATMFAAEATRFIGELFFISRYYNETFF